MEQQRRRDTNPEVALRRALHARGWRYRVDVKPEAGSRGRADLVFSRRRVAVFVDGCFWHLCPLHGTIPKTNALWWAQKLDGNLRRDRETDARLRAGGWTAIRVWEHTPVDEAVELVEAGLQGTSSPHS